MTDLRLLSVFAGLVLAIGITHAAPAPKKTEEALVKPVSTAPVLDPSAPTPLPEAGDSLSGSALLDALRSGGFVFYVRHAQIGTVTRECTTSNLSPQGESEARKLGSELRRLRIPVGEIRTSPICRALGTARLLELGEVLSDAGLSPGPEQHFARQLLLNSVPKDNTNSVLVAHVQGGAAAEKRMVLDLAETIIFRPGANRARVVARIKLDEWKSLEQ